MRTPTCHPRYHLGQDYLGRCDAQNCSRSSMVWFKRDEKRFSEADEANARARQRSRGCAQKPHTGNRRRELWLVDEIRVFSTEWVSINRKHGGLPEHKARQWCRSSSCYSVG